MEVVLPYHTIFRMSSFLVTWETCAQFVEVDIESFNLITYFTISTQ